MKKFLFVLVAVTGFIFSANAQDIILKKDGSEIKAKVLEITDQQIKYKEFDFQSGPTRNINIAEVFMVTYENGKKEVFNKIVDTKDNADNKQSKVVVERERTGIVVTPPCVKKIAYGLDFGIGGADELVINYQTIYNDDGSNIVCDKFGDENGVFSFALGPRFTYHFIPYFGADFIKINGNFGFRNNGYNSTVNYYNIQFMTGIRGNSPAFFRCISGYAAIRLGYGVGSERYRHNLSTGGLHDETNYEFVRKSLNGFCLETEVGINFTPTIFVGFSYNFQMYRPFIDEITFLPKVDYLGKEHMTSNKIHNLAFRVGFNFGKRVECKCKKKEPRTRVERVTTEKTVKEVVVVRDTVTVIKEVIREIPLEIRQTMVELSKTLFAFNEFNLNEKSISELNKVVNWLKQNPVINVEIEGHTDNKGTAEYNQQLSEERAKSVYDYFVKNGISASRLSYKGYGLTRPIADNATEAGRQQNRRVELRIVTR